MGKNTNESGFSYMDVMIAVTILLVGILGLLSALTRGIMQTNMFALQLQAKQYAISSLETIYAVRDMSSDGTGVTLGWNAVGNVGSADVPTGIFLAGEKPIHTDPGPDMIAGTADDTSPAGPDGILGNSDDGQPVNGFSRQIEIVNVPDPAKPTAPISLRQVTVTIFYYCGSIKMKEIAIGYVGNFRT